MAFEEEHKPIHETIEEENDQEIQKTSSSRQDQVTETP
jgi:hypothetical protein